MFWVMSGFEVQGPECEVERSMSCMADIFYSHELSLSCIHAIATSLRYALMAEFPHLRYRSINQDRADSRRENNDVRRTDVNWNLFLRVFSPPSSKREEILTKFLLNVSADRCMD